MDTYNKGYLNPNIIAEKISSGYLIQKINDEDVSELGMVIPAKFFDYILRRDDSDDLTGDQCVACGRGIRRGDPKKVLTWIGLNPCDIVCGLC